MTYHDDCILPNDLLEHLAEQGLESLPEMIRILVNEAMKIERQSYLGAGPYERTPECRDRANGYKAKKVKTRMGEISFDVPQVREGGFYPGALEKGLRSEGALTLTMAEMYVQGVSTRKVGATLRGIQYAVGHPREAFEIYFDYVEGLEDADHDVQYQVLLASLELYQTDPYGDSHPGAWANMHEVLVEMGLTKGEIDLEAAYSNDFIKSRSVSHGTGSGSDLGG